MPTHTPTLFRLIGRAVFGALWWTALVSAAPARVTTTISNAAAGREIPADFVGLSFEISNLLPGPDGRRIFSPENRSLVALFRAAGIRNLRVGGGTTEPKSGIPANDAKYPVPAEADIDQLFAFAEAADVHVIYTLRLLNGNAERAAAIAEYVTRRYGSRLDGLSIGNEPDWHSYHSYPGHPLDPRIVEATPGDPGSAYPSFVAQWRAFAAAVASRVPAARFFGPDTGSNFPVSGAKSTDCGGQSWTERFVHDVRGSVRLAAAAHHDYIGQGAEGVSVSAAIEAMLSRTWPAQNYPALFDHVLAPVQAAGVAYRMTECNDHTGGVDGASNAFVSALWALDYLHWHAARGALGVNFHNKRWIYTCTIVQDAKGAFHLNPKAYGLKAFSLGSAGRVEPVDLTNPESANVTAYAVRGANGHFVTIINKEHGAGARGADITLSLPAPIRRADVMFLSAPRNDPDARTGITLGGAGIGDDGAWTGDWRPLPTMGQGAWVVSVPPTCAAIVRISTS